mmetsp:Transcript_11746/g.35827  ORF Transcript_11746/g.35827 Transcript_11746/m.35827 type:complete len:423 (+) Transcript_11746:903-2171(+)
MSRSLESVLHGEVYLEALAVLEERVPRLQRLQLRFGGLTHTATGLVPKLTQLRSLLFGLSCGARLCDAQNRSLGGELVESLPLLERFTLEASHSYSEEIWEVFNYALEIPTLRHAFLNAQESQLPSKVLLRLVDRIRNSHLTTLSLDLRGVAGCDVHAARELANALQEARTITELDVQGISLGQAFCTAAEQRWIMTRNRQEFLNTEQPSTSLLVESLRRTPLFNSRVVSVLDTSAALVHPVVSPALRENELWVEKQRASVAEAESRLEATSPANAAERELAERRLLSSYEQLRAQLESQVEAIRERKQFLEVTADGLGAALDELHPGREDDAAVETLCENEDVAKILDEAVLTLHRCQEESVRALASLQALLVGKQPNGIASLQAQLEAASIARDNAVASAELFKVKCQLREKQTEEESKA